MTLWQRLMELPGPLLGLIVLIGVLISLIGTFISASGSVLVLVRQSRISEGIRKQVEENLRRTEENLAQTQEATNRIEETLEQITGGDSYCYFAPLLTGPATETLSVTIAVRTPGKPRAIYPLRDVSARIYDIYEQERQADEPVSFEEMRSRVPRVNIGTLRPHVLTTVPDWDLGPGDAHRYSIHFVALNGIFAQFLTLRKVNGMWAWASRVERDGTVIPNSLEIHDHFPRDEHGQVRW
jgi:hypothetical protein